MTDEVVVRPEDDADFDSGFSPETETPTGKTEEQVTEPAAETTPIPAEEPPPEETVSITRKEWEEIVGKARSVDELRSKIDSGFGSVGQKMQALMQRMESSGAEVEITDDMVQAIADGFGPELAEAQKKLLTDFAKHLKVRGQGPGVDTDALLAQAEQRAVFKIFEQTLTESHPDWRATIGWDETGKVIPDTAYRKWLAEQDEGYRTRVGNSFNPSTVGASIDKFRTDQQKAEADRAKKEQHDNSRRRQVVAAVNPRGSAQAIPTGRSEDDEFNDGFKSRYGGG